MDSICSFVPKVSFPFPVRIVPKMVPSKMFDQRKVGLHNCLNVPQLPYLHAIIWLGYFMRLQLQLTNHPENDYSMSYQFNNH
ncbi:hypothetical protein GQ55_8G141000 [Panicum hallii var. hallii]|jgi:hypothetical protein|uniref:Uncharacterized protein n=1 Tax=Panicum hallii var. hallii TaxID=1504633 RepID=A0A2T7CN35_9POAL|nr:hypothetical protein GQ55_8G141000 [Panicum hallii var. hallii]